MAFIIAYYVRLTTNTRKTARWHCIITLLGLYLSCAALLSSQSSAAYETGRNSGNDYLDIKLSAPIKEAADNGIPLTFDCDLRTSEMAWFISWPTQLQQHTFILSYHSLSNRYLVRSNNKEAPKNFHSIGEATDYIREQSKHLFKQYANKKAGAQMRISLNKFKLPGPIRLNAFIAEQWNINTGWIIWSPEI